MDPIQDLVERLNSTKKLRVWSVIITFFGDAIVPRGGSVSAKTVQSLLSEMNIEPGAVRTAFSRLTSDGWVVREKLGRSSFFRLSATGLAPFEAATDRIYAALPTLEAHDDGWKLVFHADTYPQPTIQRNGSSESSGGDGGGGGNADGDSFIFEGRIKQMPDWIKAQHCQTEHKQSFENLMDNFAPLQGIDLAPRSALAARCLLIHEWRRILFQFESVAPEFWTDDWPQAQCHQFVSDLYRLWLQPSETWMDEEATGLAGALPAPQTDLTARFT